KPVGQKPVSQTSLSWKDCDFTCRDAPSSAPSCSSLESRWNAFLLIQCATVLMSNNSQNIDLLMDLEQLVIMDIMVVMNVVKHAQVVITIVALHIVANARIYAIWRGETITSDISVNYDQSLTESQNFLTEHPIIHNTCNEEKNSSINMANRNENPIIDDSAPPTYEEVVVIP
ncbi:19837_t:CDS:2, partial [Dentiscutata erythropus]